MNAYDALMAACRAARDLDGTTLVQVTTMLVQTVAVQHAMDDDDAIQQAIAAVSDPEAGNGWEPSNNYDGSVVER